jgi:hypothetical protein
MDAQIQLEDPVPIPGFSEEQLATTTETIEVPLEHAVELGDNIWNITKLYGESLLEDLTPRERDAVLAGLSNTITNSPDLQNAIGITSGSANMIGESITPESGPQVLQIEPLLDALRAEIEKVAPGHLPAVEVVAVESPALGMNSVIPNPSEPLSYATVTPDQNALEKIPLSMGVPETGNMLVTDAVVEQVKLQFPSLDQFNEAQASWIEKVQGPDPRTEAWGATTWFNIAMPNHEDAFKYFSTLKIADIDALQKIEAPERAAYLADHNIRPADYNAWMDKLTEWRANKQITGITPTATFGSVASKAFAFDHITTKRV